LYKGLESSTKLQNAFPNAGRFIALRMMKEITSRLFGYSPSFLISGGGFIKDSALYMFNGLGYPLHNGYGMSETGITSVELRSKVKHRNENSIGKPFDSVRYKIEKDGVLYVSGDSICVKIIRNGVEIPMEKRYNTGDIAFEDSEGNYYLKGRIDDRIIGESGENVNPDEIEKHLDFEHALNLCVWGEGEGSAEEIALVIQLGRDLSKKKIEETAQAAFAQSDKLPGTYQIRKFYFTFDPICAETAVKVSRSYLKRGLANGSIKIYPFADVLEGRVSGREAIDPLNELAVKARDAFAEFLDVAAEDIYMDDHFIYDLNGTSLDYFSLVIKINEVMGIHLTFDKESACHTVRDFCREIEKRGLN
jgi:acyl carrier protein